MRETMAIGARQLRDEGSSGWVVCDALAAAVAVCPAGVVASRRVGQVCVALQDATRGSITVVGVGTEGGRAREMVDVFNMETFKHMMDRVLHT